MTRMGAKRRLPHWFAGLVLIAVVAACAGGGAATPRATLPGISGSGALRTLGPVGSQPPATTRPTTAPATASGSAGGSAGGSGIAGGSGSAGRSAKPFKTKNPAATPRPIVAFHGATDLEASVPARAGAP